MNATNESPYFYVIMPLDSDKQSEMKMEVIRAVANEYGFFARFPSYKNNIQSFCLNSTIQDFQKSSFILADLSYERPSCYYELGIAEAVGVIIFPIAIEGTDIHQTSRRQLVHFYNSLEQLKELVAQIIEQSNISESAS